MPPFGVPVSIPSARVDLTQYALKNLTRFTNDNGGAAGGNAAGFLRNNGRRLVAQRIGIAGSAVRVSTDNGVTWGDLFALASGALTCCEIAWDTSGANPGCNFLFGGNNALPGGAGIYRWREATGVGTKVLTSGAAIAAIGASDTVNYGLTDANPYAASAITMVAVGTNRLGHRSTDSGATWGAALVMGAGNEDLSSVCSNGSGRWLATGNDGVGGANVMLVSTDDGATWTQHFPDPCPTKVRWGGDKFIGCVNVGGVGKVLSSVLGVSWDTELSVNGDEINDVGYDNKGCYVAVGTNFIRVSDDLETWTAIRMNNLSFLNAGGGYDPSSMSIRTLKFDNVSDLSFAANRWLMTAVNGSDTNNSPMLATQSIIDAAA